MPGKSISILGLMSGSSLDGLDAAIVRFKEESSGLEWELLEAETLPFSKEWTDKLEELPGSDALDLALANVYFARYMGELLEDFLENEKIKPDCIASHGHTIYHFPERGLSLQIGDGATLSAVTGLAVICDFRSQDVALGGQGAPLAPIADRMLFPGYDFYLNLGGIANITGICGEETAAFDICPANQILNFLSGHLNLPFDDDGKYARSGKLHAGLMKELGDFDYYHQDFPKSLDNNWIRKNVFPILRSKNIPVEDKLHTAVRFIAEKIGEAVWILSEEVGLGKIQKYRMIVTGGGAFNSFLMEEIRKSCMKEINLEIITPSENIVSFKEAILVALLGFLRLQNRPNCISQVTGATEDVIGGAIYQGHKQILKNQ